MHASEIEMGDIYTLKGTTFDVRVLGRHFDDDEVFFVREIKNRELRSVKASLLAPKITERTIYAAVGIIDGRFALGDTKDNLKHAENSFHHHCPDAKWYTTLKTTIEE